MICQTGEIFDFLSPYGSLRVRGYVIEYEEAGDKNPYYRILAAIRIGIGDFQDRRGQGATIVTLPERIVTGPPAT